MFNLTSTDKSVTPRVCVCVCVCVCVLCCHAGFILVSLSLTVRCVGGHFTLFVYEFNPNYIYIHTYIYNTAKLTS